MELRRCFLPLLVLSHPIEIDGPLHVLGDKVCRIFLGAAGTPVPPLSMSHAQILLLLYFDAVPG